MMADQLAHDASPAPAAPPPRTTGLIHRICVAEAHHLAGRSVPDGLGVLTVDGGTWAYCASARLNDPHEWLEIDPLALHEIRHARSWKAAAART